MMCNIPQAEHTQGMGAPPVEGLGVSSEDPEQTVLNMVLAVGEEHINMTEITQSRVQVVPVNKGFAGLYGGIKLNGYIYYC